ncbi:MAG: phosphatidylserine decarboxylase [Candidatus Acidiferrales bacterium]
MVRIGYAFASVPAAAGALLLWREWWIAGGVLLALAGFVLFFFRDPERKIPDAPGAIVSPADGWVLSVGEASLNGATHGRISIFLSLFDVHVNRAPIAGRIASAEYRRGKFLIASRDAAALLNEQNEITLEGEGTRVVFRQIAGVLARRIEFWKKPGDTLARGERVGMIRFGSRVEVFFEPRFRTRVKPGDHVRGGASILAQRD